MTHTFLVELTDEVKGYEREVEQLEMTYGIEEFDLKKHDSDLLDKVADRIHQKMCSENCGERQCVDAMDRCVWYEYVTEAIAELKAEVRE